MDPRDYRDLTNDADADRYMTVGQTDWASIIREKPDNKPVGGRTMSWIETYYAPLVGCTIQAVKIASEDDDQWPILTLTRGDETLHVEVWSDDEGSRPGWLQVGETAPFIARHAASRLDDRHLPAERMSAGWRTRKARQDA